MKTVTQKLQAQDVMTREPVCVEPWMSIAQLAKLFSQYEISGAPVVDHQGRVIGMVSKTDVIQRCMEGFEGVPPGYLFEMLSASGAEDREVSPVSEVRVEDFMSPEPVMVGPATSLARIAALMFKNRIHRIVVADEMKKPVGIITSMDVLSAFPSERG